MMARYWFLVGLILVGCGSSEAQLDPRYELPGPFEVGNTTLVVTDEVRNRSLTIEVWYPRTGTPGQQSPIEEFVDDGPERETYRSLLMDAPTGCPSTQTNSQRDSAPLENGPFPLLVFSHCHNCVRFSSFAIAERLASHGFVVAAPDHADNTLFDNLAGTGVELSSEFLQVRAKDISFVIDTLLAGVNTIEIDPKRIGVYGHSYGAVTTGLVLQDDPRPIAGFAIASPMENPLVEGVDIDLIEDPVGFLVAVEDNSITEIGNLFIRNNFRDVPTTAWKGEVADAGHWSFADICALEPQFEACCGMANRQTDGNPFTYLPVADGIAMAQAYVTAFFSAHLMDDSNAIRYLTADRFSGLISVEQHP